MELSNRGRAKAPIEPSVRALPFDQRRAGGGARAWLVGLGSLSLAALAAAGPLGIEPWLRPLLNPLAESGVDSRLIAQAAMVLGACAMLLFTLRQQVQGMLDGDQTERAVTELGADFVQAEEGLQELRSGQLDLRTQVLRLCVSLDKPDLGTNEKNMTEAVFNLAASLDRVHAHLDKSMTKNTSGLTTEVQSQVAGLSQLVERSRDFLQESFEGLEDRLGKSIAAIPVVELPSVDHSIADERNAPELACPSHEAGELAQESDGPWDQVHGSTETLPKESVPEDLPAAHEPEEWDDLPDPEPLPEFQILDLGLLEHLDDELGDTDDTDGLLMDLDRVASLMPSEPDSTDELELPTFAQFERPAPEFSGGAADENQDPSRDKRWPDERPSPGNLRPDHGENPGPPPIWDLFGTE